MDTTLIRQRRLELALSRRAVAREVGISEGAVARVEQGDAADDWTLRQLRSLATALAVDLTDLLRHQDTPATAEANDVELIGSLLARFRRLVPTSALAHATGWDLPRVNRAVHALDAAAHPTGQRVQRLRGGVALRPARSEADAEQLGHLLRRELARTKMSSSQLAILAAVADGTIGEQHFNEADRLAYASLINAGLVAETPSGPRLTDASALGLSASPDDAA